MYFKQKTTRDRDFDTLEDHGYNGKRIDKIYQQTKNYRLEEARKELIRAVRSNDKRQIAKMEKIIQSIRS